MSGHSQDRGAATAQPIALTAGSHSISNQHKTQKCNNLNYLEKRTKGNSVKALNSLQLRKSLKIRLINTA